jgi:hypothetical protein
LAILARETGGSTQELTLLKKTVYLNPDFVLGHFQIGLHHLHAGNPGRPALAPQRAADHRRPGARRPDRRRA